MANISDRSFLLVINVEGLSISYLVASTYDEDDWAWKGLFTEVDSSQAAQVPTSAEGALRLAFDDIPGAFDTPYEALGAVAEHLAKRHDPKIDLIDDELRL